MYALSEASFEESELSEEGSPPIRSLHNLKQPAKKKQVVLRSSVLTKAIGHSPLFVDEPKSHGSMMNSRSPDIYKGAKQILEARKFKKRMQNKR
mmetsp:Transcript_21701/g.33422  ORF Transcript_21701/g.33422 Transcript_21701/m.33422 type:complete len:94 (+) Transcript_21701:2453-2734(+)